ncbi:D-3-phosphoglycerate dehydrogenase [Halanaerobium saccharolyticum subsp. saccharolyticum DSM 6643]|uniref:D-3-phosphoglycerate dehydrogenase n=1 Tax=Halanaerobium saccharolyticum subsp. saccharolyticum DSM 6643 TaxID=1293054 RepID=M5E084_9FIRM|nr:NAD(P)-dependent oxidoreductase [Halanaerobium saccharolyticum]CCU78949.1 D-3-phosphoglycerate dehydrogenase [Halanaerobium saccharolyticum subsp. saccharolyticum DSM 6643]
MITKYIPEKGLQELKKNCQIIMPEKGKPFSDKYILEIAADIDALIAVRFNVSSEFINRAKNLKIISVYGVGIDNMDIEKVSKNNILVSNLPEVVTEPTAELAFGLMLALSRRIVEADYFVKNENDKNWHPFLLISNELYDKKLGIIGFGRIGQAVARRALAFGMKVYFYDKAYSNNDKFNMDVNYSSFFDILENTDYITLHVPHVRSTHHLISKNEFKKMKNSTFLINNSRGPVVDQQELINALKNKEIAGAALDVFENEPEVPKELTEFKNVVLTPHLGTTTIETKTKMAFEASKKIIQFINGKMPENIVNK